MGNKSSIIIPSERFVINPEIQNFNFNEYFDKFKYDILSKYENKIITREKINAINFIEEIKCIFEDYSKLEHCFQNNIKVFQFETKKILFREKIDKIVINYANLYEFDYELVKILRFIIERFEAKLNLLYNIKNLQ